MLNEQESALIPQAGEALAQSIANLFTTRLLPPGPALDEVRRQAVALATNALRMAIENERERCANLVFTSTSEGEYVGEDKERWDVCMQRTLAKISAAIRAGE